MDELDARRDRWMAALGRVVRAVQSHRAHQWMFRMWVLHGRPRWRWLFETITATGTHDPEESWTKDKLIKNDVYRDRLLAQEIAAFVDLGDALGMTGAQRHAMFEKFLHVDWMRRSAISVQELCMYCGLRRTRFADCILPLPRANDGFRQFHHRFELVQLMAALFNVCTLPAAKLVAWVVDQAKVDPIVQTLVPDCDKNPPLRLQLAQLLVFVTGTLTPNEKYLKSALESLYLSTSDTRTASSHGMTTLESFLRRFPVLIFPVFWLQRTLRRRVMGTKFWTQLQAKRASWGSSQIFYTPLELMEEARAYTLADTGGMRTKDDGEINQTATKSTHLLAKVLPVATQDADESNLGVEDDSESFELAATIQQYSNEAVAWEVTADNLLAAIHIKQVQMDGNATLDSSKAVGVEHLRIMKALKDGTLSPTEAVSIRKSIVKQYGYHFADFIVGYSHLKPQRRNPVASHKQSKRKSNDDDKTSLPENWIKLFDQSTQRTFYYNALTGESEWQIPPH
ncbi:hypothetical protein H310_03727 [Aphanomyces invadans]|uniref:WW domain-containing protein n=1 Tax=Aphanomyces invadans TaxID=157072 RepID=A0A024UJU2_9STRA|nr:hypothetical protein H310_03727 [Aphanomyces invadans]ETW06142.1 hypothetical protein H310_03727 [Aphanomyces invadans]|eukprot:XP_008865919.1 hypothetical protein H310_03727 [Aphanomyces invadans]